LLGGIIVKSPNKGLKSLKTGPIQANFEIRHDCDIIKCHSIVLCTISKFFRNLFDNDQNIDFYSLEINGGHESLIKVIDFLYGKKIHVNSDNIEMLYVFSLFFKIADLIKPLKNVFKDHLTLVTVFDSTKLFCRYKLDTKYHKRFICRHFIDLIKNDSFNTLPIEFLADVIGSDSLRITAEDQIVYWLLDFLLIKQSEALPLVDLLKLEYITQNTLFDLLKCPIIDPKRVLEKFEDAKQNPTKQRLMIIEEEIVQSALESSMSLTQDTQIGIIGYFIENRIPISIKVSSTHDPYFNSRNLLEIKDYHKCWYSIDSPDQFIMYDFYPYLVQPLQYQIRSYGGEKNSCHMKSWSLSGSIDQYKWTVLDSKKNNDALNSGYSLGNFEISDTRFVRFLRIEQTGKNWRGDNSMIVSYVEFFGRITKVHQ